MSVKESNSGLDKVTMNYHTECMRYVVDKNAEEIQALIDLIAPKVVELTTLVREKFPIITPRDNAYVLYSIDKTTELLNGYDDDLRLVVRVYQDRVLYALEQVESETHTSQKLIIVDVEPWEKYPNGSVGICWVDEDFMTSALNLRSYGADALNRYTVWGFSGSYDSRDLFVDLFDKRHFIDYGLKE